MFRFLINSLAFGLLILTAGCSSQNNSALTYEYRSYPSFHAGYWVDFDPGMKKISFHMDHKVYLIDKASARGCKMMDSAQIRRIQDYIPKGFTSVKLLGNTESGRLLKLFNKLLKCEQKESVGLDGISDVFIKNNGTERIKNSFWSPGKDSKAGHLIIALTDAIIKIYSDNSDVADAIEDSRRYLDDKDFIVESKDPLYIKLLKAQHSCTDLRKEVDKLPKAREIYIDLTNLEGHGDKCITTVFQEKYDSIRWIAPNLFEFFHKIIGNKKPSSDGRDR